MHDYKLFSPGNWLQALNRVQRDRVEVGLWTALASQQPRGRHVAVLALQDQRRMHQVERRQGKQHRQAVEIELVPFLSQQRVRVVGAAAKLDQAKDDAFLKAGAQAFQSMRPARMAVKGCSRKKRTLLPR